MDAVEYLMTIYRMCGDSDRCDDCPIYETTGRNCGMAYSNAEMLAGHVGIVEQWAKEHPARTRQSVFLEQYPNAMTFDDGTPNICPRDVDKTIMQRCGGLCDTCKIEYWSQEVTDESKG